VTERLQFFAPCPIGVEPLLANELRRLGLKGVRPQRSGVLFSGTVTDAQRAIFWTRLASRVLLTLGQVDASSADALYEARRRPSVSTSRAFRCIGAATASRGYRSRPR